MHDMGDVTIIHCLAFELFQTMIGIGTNLWVETNVLGIKCKASKAALIHKFLLQTSSQIKNKD